MISCLFFTSAADNLSWQRCHADCGSSEEPAAERAKVIRLVVLEEGLCEDEMQVCFIRQITSLD